MDSRQAITNYSLKHHRLVTVVMLAFTLSSGALIPLIHVDTDPENMPSEDEPVRVFHNETKERFALNDIVVVGIVNDEHPNEVFNPSSLGRIYELTEFAKRLRWQDEDNPDEQVGVVGVDLLASSTVDYIGQGSPGEVKFEWLMRKPLSTEAEALEIRDKAMSNPLLKGTVVSEDGKAICLYLPLTSKDLSYRVYRELRERIATFDGEDEYHITGLPAAEDTFGIEMFVQMGGICALGYVGDICFHVFVFPQGGFDCFCDDSCAGFGGFDDGSFNRAGVPSAYNELDDTDIFDADIGCRLGAHSFRIFRPVHEGEGEGTDDAGGHE